MDLEIVNLVTPEICIKDLGVLSPACTKNFHFLANIVPLENSCVYTWSDVDKESDDEIPDILDLPSSSR